MVTRHAQRVAAFGVADVNAPGRARESLARRERAERTVQATARTVRPDAVPPLEFAQA